MNQLSGHSFFVQVDYFLSLDENSAYRNDVIWTDESRTNIRAFRGLFGIRNFSRALDQIDAVDQFRYLG